MCDSRLEEYKLLVDNKVVISSKSVDLIFADPPYIIQKKYIKIKYQKNCNFSGIF